MGSSTSYINKALKLNFLSTFALFLGAKVAEVWLDEYSLLIRATF
jgi:hypothetical protein